MTKKELMTVASPEALDLLRQEFPVEQGVQRTWLPRLAFCSQDKTEEFKNKAGKKELKIVKEAGTFTIERQSEEKDEEGKSIWIKDDLGTEIEGTVIYQRKQLRYYDEKTETYTSSPIYDTDEEVIPLFCNKEEITRGTPEELKAKYQTVTDDGKKKSKLEDNRVLYVLYRDELFQMTLRGSSMFAFMTWGKKHLPPANLTKFSSEPMEKGSICWNKMTFEVIRPLNSDEVNKVLELVAEIKHGIQQEKDYYAQQDKVSELDKKF